MTSFGAFVHDAMSFFLHAGDTTVTINPPWLCLNLGHLTCLSKIKDELLFSAAWSRGLAFGSKPTFTGSLHKLHEHIKNQCVGFSGSEIADCNQHTSPSPSKCLGETVTATKLAKNVKGPLYCQYLVCSFLATVETWQFNMAALYLLIFIDHSKVTKTQLL